jgi:TRAP-type transport system periplasmic protein
MRSFLPRWMVTCMGLLAFFVAGSASGETVELRFSAFIPPQHVQLKEVIVPWTEDIGKLSGGKVKISIHPSAELGPAPAQYDMVLKGEADLAFGLPAYTPDRFPLSSVFELPFLVKNAEYGSIVLWEIYKNYLRDEFRDVKVLWMFVHSPGQLISKKAVESLEDIRGMKIRSPGPIMSRMIDKFGAIPVTMPINKAYDALAAGEADAVVTPWETLVPFRFYEHCRFATVLDLYVMPFFVIMNQGRYDALSPDLKRVFDENSGDIMSARAGKAFDQGEIAGRDLFSRNGGRIIELSPNEKIRWERIAVTVGDQWAEDMSAKELPGVEVLEATTHMLLQAR